MKYEELTPEEQKSFKSYVYGNKYGALPLPIIWNFVVFFLAIPQLTSDAYWKYDIEGIFTLLAITAPGIILLVALIISILTDKIDNYSFVRGKIVDRWYKISKNNRYYAKIELENGVVKENKLIESRVYHREGDDILYVNKNGKKEYVL